MAIFLTYLLMPLITIIFFIFIWIIAAKNKLLKNKKFIFYILISAIILALPALFGFISYWFMPYIYIGVQVYSLAMGWLNIKYMNKYMKDVVNRPFIFQFLLSLTAMLLGIGLFSVAFNLCNELLYGIMASTCIIPFILPVLYQQTYYSYVNIPIEIYKIWFFSDIDSSQKDQMDINNLFVIDIELFKNTNNTDLLHITAKTSEHIIFGDWFQIFLTDYNKKAPENPIHYKGDEDFGWVFYTKASVFKRRKYIDPDQTFKQNKLGTHSSIIARRVKDTITKEIILNEAQNIA